MKNFIIKGALLLSLFSTISLNAQAVKANDELPTEFTDDMAVVFGKKDSQQQAAATEYALWSNQLQEYFFNSGDTFSIAMTLSAKVSAIKNAKLVSKINQEDELTQQLNDLSYQPIADTLNLLITRKNLNQETLDVLTGLCFEEALKEYCHAKVLLQKRMESDSHNLQAYLRPFDLAVKAKDQSALKNLLVLMANSQHSHTVFLITSEMSELIDQFLADNPMPKPYIDSMITDYQKLSGISPTFKAKLTELMHAYMPSFVKSTYIYLNDLPPYRTLLDFCKQQKGAAEHCRDIAQIMINKSNTLLDKGLGHALLIASYEAEKNATGIQAAKDLNDQFKAGYQCIQQLASSEYFMDDYFDEDYQKISMSNTDQYERIIQLAEYRYRKLKSQGNENAVNPNSCLQESNS